MYRKKKGSSATSMTIIVLCMVIFLTSLLAYLTMRSSVPAGYVGVQVNKYGTEKGVGEKVLPPGRYFLNWNQELYLFPTFSQNYVWTAGNDEGSLNDESVSFQDVNGTNLNADVGITYSIDNEKAYITFQKYRKGVEEITDVYLRNMVRDALNTETSRMVVSDIYGTKREELMARVTEKVSSAVKPFGINIERVYWINAIRLPETIAESVNAKVKATQVALQRENDLQTAVAQAKIQETEALARANAVKIEAQAQAEANRILAQSLTPELVNYRAIDKWDGKLPVMTGGTTPIVDVTSVLPAAK